MAFGNEIGVYLDDYNKLESLVAKNFGNIILEVDIDTLINQQNTRTIGFTTNNKFVEYRGEKVNLDEALNVYENVLT